MINQKKVIFVVKEYTENVFLGGGEKVNHFIIKELLKRNYIVDVYANISYIKKSNIVNLYIKDKDFYNNFENIVKNYDLVISTDLECPSEIAYSHNHSYLWKKNKIKLFICKIFSKAYKRKIINYKKELKNVSKINKIVISSNIIKEDYVKNYNIPTDKIYILPPGVEIKEEKIKTKNDNIFKFGIVAKSFNKKGAFITLFSVFYLKNKYKNFKVKIINKDTFKNSINKFIIILLTKILNIENYIEYMPLQEDMDSFYNSIDCLLVPSIKEPFGLVVTEAMAHSLPTIVSSVTGAADIIKNEENGFIIDYSKLNKSKELFKTMCKVLNLNDEKYKNISKNAYDTVKNMTYDKFAEEFVNIAEKINKI